MDAHHRRAGASRRRPALSARWLHVAAGALALAVGACATVAPGSFDALFGSADPTRFDAPTPPSADPGGSPAVSYAKDVQPILDRRCVVCHACYDAPCQFKATSWEGVARGASKTPVYHASRLHAADPTRLYVDATTASEWRMRGFFPALNEHEPTPEANRTASLMHRLLTLKQRHPQLDDRPVTDGGLDVSPDRPLACPAGVEIADYERRTPQGGMPYGLPALAPREHGVLTRWLEAGAPAEARPGLPPSLQARVDVWERFLNGDSPKERLFARYAYEHLFLAHLHFDEEPGRRFFTLVRSTTPPGQPPRVVASRRPVDDPGVQRPYYRLVEERETIVAKTHMPYALNAARMARWRELFLDAPFRVDRLPGYTSDTAANPFLTFAVLPVGARYRFLLDEAAFTIMGFIKGPVCRGQTALDVIDDRFWVTFLAPSDEYDGGLAELLRREGNLLRLPTGSSDTGTVIPWLYYATLENRYLADRSRFLTDVLRRSRAKLDLDLVWDGDGRNGNAGLTVFRHDDSASVVKGLIGPAPKTGWVIGYPLLERVHYLLVANFDVYGNLGHQLNSRLYMDYLRMEGEFNFLSLLPSEERVRVRDGWYRETPDPVRDQVYGGPATTLGVESAVRYTTSDPKTELFSLLAARLAPVRDTRSGAARPIPADLLAPLRDLSALRGAALRWLPEFAALVVERGDGTPVTFSLLRDTGHASVSHLQEGPELRPDENTLNVVPGLVGSYPNAFYRVRAAELPSMARAIAGLRSEGDYRAFSRRFAVRRDDRDFWAFSDAVHERFARDEPLESGMLDYNRLERR